MKFINGFLIACILIFWIQDRQERNVFGSMAKSINTDSLMESSTRYVYNLISPRLEILPATEPGLFRSVEFDMNTGAGACGSYSYVLARLLMEFDIETRFCQMLVNGKYGGHIVIEAYYKGQWRVLDPSYGLWFEARQPGENGNIHSFEWVSKHWSDMKDQLPANYNPAYRYEGVRYTNTDKVPAMFVPEGKSLRSLFVQKWWFFLVVSMFIFSVINIWWIIHRVKNH